MPRRSAASLKTMLSSLLPQSAASDSNGGGSTISNASMVLRSSSFGVEYRDLPASAASLLHDSIVSGVTFP